MNTTGRQFDGKLAPERLSTPVRVLVVDDSAVMRTILTEILSSDPLIEVVGTAADPAIAERKIQQLQPDVLTLDVIMPGLDGLAFLRMLMSSRPVPVVMISALTQTGTQTALEALRIGAVDIVGKPDTIDSHHWVDLRDDLIAKVKSAARARLRASYGRRRLRAPVLAQPVTESVKVVAIGASTGGVAVLNELVPALSIDCPPVLIAQHMPPRFTGLLADRLDRISNVRVQEAVHGLVIAAGNVYIAPGGLHLSLALSRAGYACVLSDGDPVNGHRPSVDFLFASVAQIVGRESVGILLTGMGKDGAEGLLAMRRAGAATACQDEASSLIYGMPKAAFDLGAVQREISGFEAAAYIMGFSGSRLKRSV